MASTRKDVDVVGVAPKSVNRDDSSNPIGGGHGNAHKSGSGAAGHGNAQLSGTVNNRGSNPDPSS